MAQEVITKQSVVETEPVVATTVKPVAVDHVATVTKEDVESAEVGFKFYQIIYFLFGVLEFLIAIRFLLKIFAANSANAFVSFIYGITAPFVYPFLSIFKVPVIEGSVIEWGTLIAMAIYALIAYALVQLVIIITTKRGTSIE